MQHPSPRIARSGRWSMCERAKYGEGGQHSESHRAPLMPAPVANRSLRRRSEDPLTSPLVPVRELLCGRRPRVWIPTSRPVHGSRIVGHEASIRSSASNTQIVAAAQLTKHPLPLVPTVVPPPRSRQQPRSPLEILRTPPPRPALGPGIWWRDYTDPAMLALTAAESPSPNATATPTPRRCRRCQ